jgi:hypothetical protein
MSTSTGCSLLVRYRIEPAANLSARPRRLQPSNSLALVREGSFRLRASYMTWDALHFWDGTFSHQSLSSSFFVLLSKASVFICSALVLARHESATILLHVNVKPSP